jgi:hypothetical protein
MDATVPLKNNEVSKSIYQALNLDSSDEAPNTAVNLLSPTIEVNPILVKFPDVCLYTTGTGTQTIYTTPTDRDFYLTGAWISAVNGGANTGLLTIIEATINGTNRIILGVALIFQVANGQSSTMNFTHPIKVDRGTAILLNNVGTPLNAVGGIIGFTYDNDIYNFEVPPTGNLTPSEITEYF